MSEEAAHETSGGVNADKRALIKKLAAGTAFAVPLILSYSVKDLAQAQPGSVTVTTIIGTSVVITTVTLTTTLTITATP